MKEILEALGTRIKSPVLGYYSIAFVIFNWKPLFYLFFQNEGVIERFSYFDDNTDFWSLIFNPVIFASALAVIYPWVNYLFLKTCAKPTDLRNLIQAQSEHNLLVKKQELEEARSALLETAEKELIDRAKRDQELNTIEDEEAREKLKSEINELREQRDQLTSSNPESDNYKKYKELMDIANDFRTRANETQNSYDSSSLLDKAQKIEAKAHDLVLD